MSPADRADLVPIRVILACQIRSMKPARHHARSIPLFIAVLAVCAALVPSASQAYPRSLSCNYVDAEPPGPAGNVVEIAGNDNVQVRREGERILVGSSAANGPRQFEEISCGTQATVTNVDRIVYRGEPVPGNAEHQFLLDLRQGALAPGATPEAEDSEIEVEVVLPPQQGAHPRVQLLTGEGRDSIELHGGAGRLVVSLEPWPSQRPSPSGGAPDADLIVATPPRTVELKVHTGEGGDVLDGRGLDRHRGLVRSLLLAGDEGKDALLGTERSDQLQGGAGPDRLYGRDGHDLLYPSAGEDTTSGGSGDDFISGGRGSSEPDIQPDNYYGGSGDDYIDARVGGRDTIDCGTGRDEAVADREDELLDDDCERVRGAAVK
jgi:Ca2+-binding RTX toxin-like protein